MTGGPAAGGTGGILPNKAAEDDAQELGRWPRQRSRRLAEGKQAAALGLKPTAGSRRASPGSAALLRRPHQDEEQLALRGRPRQPGSLVRGCRHHDQPVGFGGARAIGPSCRPGPRSTGRGRTRPAPPRGTAGRSRWPPVRTTLTSCPGETSWMEEGSAIRKGTAAEPGGVPARRPGPEQLGIGQQLAFPQRGCQLLARCLAAVAHRPCCQQPRRDPHRHQVAAAKAVPAGRSRAAARAVDSVGGRGSELVDRYRLLQAQSSRAMARRRFRLSQDDSRWPSPPAACGVDGCRRRPGARARADPRLGRKRVAGMGPTLRCAGLSATTAARCLCGQQVVPAWSGAVA